MPANKCTSSAISDATITLQSPTVEDAKDIHALVQVSPPLEPNSAYAYLLLCSHFAENGIVARCEGELAGFVCGYRIPDRPDTIFVWQIGVHPDFRGRALGSRMLSGLADRSIATGVRFLEASVSPSNVASNRTFARFAEQRGCAIVEEAFFEPDCFPASKHEAERLVRIGPFAT